MCVDIYINLCKCTIVFVCVDMCRCVYVYVCVWPEVSVN